MTQISSKIMHETADGVMVTVRVSPGASRTAVLGLLEDDARPAVRIAVAAPPVEGKSNQALIAFLAKSCGIARTRVVLHSGLTSRTKVVLLHGLSCAAVQQALMPG